MNNHLIRLAGANRFVVRVLMLSGGTVVGQGLLIIASPFLTRLYTPEEFGLFAIFASFSAIITTIVGLRYEFAVPVVRGGDEAASMVVVSALTAILVSLSVAMAVWLGGERTAAMVGAPGLAALFWILPPAVLAYGLGSSLSYWSVRQGTFRTNATNRIVYFATQAVSQLAFGLMGSGGLGLVAGYALGYLARFLHFASALSSEDRAAFASVSTADIRRSAILHWRYPAFQASSSILQSSCQMLPTVLVGILYGPAMAGWYGLGQRIVGLPVRVLSEAASQVFLNEVKDLGGPALNRLFLRTGGVFLLMGLVILMPVALFGPSLFAVVFGEPWREAGEIVRLLAPLYLARFVVLPISQTLNVVGRLDLHLVSSLLAAVALISSFAAGWWWELEASWTIALFSLTSTLAFLFYFAASWVMVRRRIPKVEEV